MQILKLTKVYIILENFQSLALKKKKKKKTKRNKIENLQNLYAIYIFFRV